MLIWLAIPIVKRLVANQVTKWLLGNLITNFYLKLNMAENVMESDDSGHKVMIEGKLVDTCGIDGTRMMCCPINNAFTILGKKYTILILRNMMAFKHTKFSEFLDTIDGINAKTLSKRLREMEEDEIINRKIVQKNPIRIENKLTEKGWALKPIISAMAEFSMSQCADVLFKDKKPRILKDIKEDNPIMIFK